MHTYKVVIVYINGSTTTLYYDKSLKLKDFVEKFNVEYQNNKNNYFSFIGEESMTMVNKDNVAFYTIEEEK